MRTNFQPSTLNFQILFLTFFTPLLWTGGGGEAYAQKKNPTKAQKLFAQTDALLNDQEYQAAADVLNKAIEYDPGYTDAYLLLSDVYVVMKKYDSAKIQLLKVNDMGNGYVKRTYIKLAEAEIKTGNYSAAIPYLEKFMKLPDVVYSMKVKAEGYLRQCNFAIEMMKHPVPFNPINLGDSINTGFAEYFPAITADEHILIFTVDIVDEKERHNEDFFISRKTDGVWRKARNLGPPINTPFNEGAQSISPDGKSIFFAVCNDPSGYGSCDIYITERTGDQWTLPQNIGAPVNTAAWESQPSISADGRALYFCSNRKGTLGGMDIWVSYKGDDGRWSIPVNLGENINTRGDEGTPFIHPDNATLYFASGGHPGMGQADIFFSRRDENGNWKKPVNLGYPINTQNHEGALIVTTSGQYAYFSSDRKDTRGELDLYSFELYPEARPMQVTYVKGNVFDAKTRQKLESRIELIDLETTKTVTESASDKTNGEFLVCIPAGKNYALNVSHKGYLFYSENFSLKEHNPEKPYLMDIPLQPINVGESVVLKNIFFETDSYQLKEESKAELNKLIAFLKENPFTKIQIAGHTDNTGNREHNQKLSENRAKAVYDFLLANQVDKARLSFKGYGANKPIASNDTPEGKAQNRRTEFVVTEK